MIDIDDKKRRELEELLPFLVNGTLEGDELAEVAAAVEQDADLAFEMQHLQHVRADIRRRDVTQTPAEFGLARLMRDIDAEGAMAAPASPAANTNTRIWQFAAAAAIAVLAVQSTIMLTAPEQPGYELASGGVAAFDGPVLTVAFRENATEGDIRALLLSLDLEFVGGPSALGLYSIGALDDASAEAALVGLNAADALVESAERN